jgi:sugar lactone lactonase YvrE
MRTILRNWKRVLAIGAVLTLGVCLLTSQTRAEDNEKPKSETKEKPAPKKVKAARKAKPAETYEQRLAREEKDRNADPAWRPSHTKSAVIKINQGGGKTIALNNYCLNLDGNILACCGGERVEYSYDQKTGEATPKTVGEPAEIRVLDPDGKLLKTWKMDFKPEAICVADDGTIFVAGDGHVAKLDQEGKVIKTVASPQMAELPPLPAIPEKKEEDKAAKEAREKKVAELRAKVNEAQAAYRKAIKDAMPKDVKPQDLTEEQQREVQKKLEEPMGKLMAASNALREASTTPEKAAMQKRAEILRKAAVNGIAVSKDDVFVTCSMAKTYGYAVWRLDRELANPKKIIEGLRGCCGQMDVQARDGEVWIPHNCQHRVERFDREGKKLLSFGKSDRKKADGFGGCCEPKNLRFGADGTLYTCESGPPVVVKHFTTEGKFLGVVAVPVFNSGCVRVTVEVSRDGSTVYVMSPSENTIYVMSNKG